MIRVSLTTLVFVYLGLFLGTVLIAWLIWNLRRIRRERFALRHRLRCAMCAFEFEDRSDAVLPICPRCGNRNERVPFSSL